MLASDCALNHSTFFEICRLSFFMILIVLTPPRMFENHFIIYIWSAGAERMPTKKKLTQIGILEASKGSNLHL
jgi:hypothetical protein